MKLDYCPKCGDDTPSIDSCREMQVSIIRCGCCEYKVIRKQPEDKISEYWNKLKRKPVEVLLKKFV